MGDKEALQLCSHIEWPEEQGCSQSHPSSGIRDCCAYEPALSDYGDASARNGFAIRALDLDN